MSELACLYAQDVLIGFLKNAQDVLKYAQNILTPY